MGTGAVTALSGLTLDIPESTVCVMRGPNGSGKSTLIDILTGDLEPTAGQVALAAANARRPRVSIVRQFDDLLPQLTVLEHFDLLNLAGDVPRMVEPLLQLRIGNLTRGERQNVAVALALAVEPQVLLADEPTAALTAAEGEALYDLLAREVRARGVTLLLVTHDVHAERIADRVIGLRNGRISEEWLPGHTPRQVIDVDGWLRLPDEVHGTLQRTVTVTPTASGAAVLGSDHNVRIATSPRRRHEVHSTALLRIMDLAGGHGARGVFSDVTHDFLRGSITAITGPPASGKSSLLRSIAGLAPLKSGRIQWSTELLGPPPCFSVELPFAMHLSLDELTANTRVLSSFDALRFSNRPLHTLSGGQYQRALVALSMDHPSELILLDDPTSGLDEEIARLVLDNLEGSDKTWIIATHDSRVLDIADSVLTLG